MKRKLSILLAALMAAGTTSVSFGAVTFADINDAPWEGAKSYINSVASLNLMVGDTNAAGQTVFRPRDRVTYCETTQLIYQILKNTGKVSSATSLVSKWTPIMSSYSIPSWAYEAVAYALENNILSLSDVQRFVSVSSSGSVSNNYAKREDVAVIFGKAIAQFKGTDTSVGLTFADSNKIASTSVPYITLLAKLNILVGDDNNNFNPKNDINRAEMAVVTSKAYNALNGVTSGSTDTPTTSTGVKGTITKIDDYQSNRMITMNVNGQVVGYIGDDDTNVVTESGSEEISFYDLNIGDVITVEATGSTIKKITVNSAVSTSSKEEEGRVDEVLNDRIYIDGKSKPYYFASNLKITIDGDSSSVKDLIEAWEEGTVDVTLTLNSSDDVTKIVAKTSTSDGVTGILVSIDSESLKMKRTNSSGNKTYDFASNISFRLEGKSSTYREIRDALDDADDLYIRITLNSNDLITRLEASEDDFETSSSTVEGTIYAMDNSTIEVKRSSGSRKEYDFASGATFYWEGSTSTKSNVLRKFNNEDSVYVKITLNSDGEAKTIRASLDEDSSSSTITGTLRDISSSSVEVRKSGSSAKEYDLASGCKYYLDDKSSTRSKVTDEFDDDNIEEVKITLNSDDEVTKLEAFTSDYDEDDESEVKGEIRSLDSDEISIKPSGKSTKTYELASSVKYYLDGGSSKRSELEDLLDDDETLNATVKLDSKDRVTRVDAELESSGSTVKGTIDLVSSSGDRIKVKGKWYYVNYKADIKLDGSSIDLDELEDEVNDNDDITATLYLDKNDDVEKIIART